MKAIVVSEFGPPSVLKFISNVSIPILSKDQALVRVKAIGVNPVETYIRSGSFPICKSMKLPYTPGSDCAGVIEKIDNSSNSNLSVGQRVYSFICTSGSYAEFAAVDLKHLYSLPDSLSFEQGASLGIPYFTAYRALCINGHLKKGETVLIHGATGGVGIACCQIAAYLGARVLGTCGSTKGGEVLLSNGAEKIFPHNDYDNIMKATEGRGVDLLIEMLANQNLSDDCLLMNDFGRIMVVGSRGSLDFDPRLIMFKEISIQGVARTHSKAEDCLKTADFLQELFSKSNYKPVIERTFSLEEADLAHQEIISPSEEAKSGKYILLT